MPKISIQDASDLLGVHPDTLIRWEEEGKIVAELTSGGHRRYDVVKLLGTVEREGKTICYARVSTLPQKEDLQRQSLVLAGYCERHGWEYEIITDIGSGINARLAWFNEVGETASHALWLSDWLSRTKTAY